MHVLSDQTKAVVLELLRTGLGTGNPLDVELSVKTLSTAPSLDWEAVIDLAQRQEVSSFVFDGFSRLFEMGAVIPEMPLMLKKQWIGTVLQMEAMALDQELKAQRMAKYFAEHALRTYILKGKTIAECYPNPYRRMSADIDCFLLPADGTDFNAWERGNTLMEEKGIEVSRVFYKNSSFMMKGLMVENHRFMTPFRGNKRLAALEIRMQELIRKDAGTDRFDETDLCRPPLLVSSLFLIEHAYSHFLHEGLTLRHIIDWMMFRRRHESEMDWDDFNAGIDAFGFRRFYDAYTHVGEFILGKREVLSESEQRMMDSVWEGLDLHDTARGLRGKLNLAGNTLRAAWKYRLFSPDSMCHALWIQVRGVIFQKHPTLKLSNNKLI